ncbi:hypothetical protein ALC57_11949 [Trachymyrmex cornetzi]|uniref:Uncharacterized protein n=1 Tax=Trachymyrmex cornetzi TaxID=471704 RepID=A0A151J1U1_9HYME|nr:hypothetical protein ALC57_11949 [Trachymyrmex cornetzi]
MRVQTLIISVALANDGRRDVNYEKRIKPLSLWDGIKFKHSARIINLVSPVSDCPNETINQLQMHVLFALPVLRNCYTLRRVDTYLKVARHINSWPRT